MLRLVIALSFAHSATAASNTCADPTRLMPECVECIPGLHGSKCGSMTQITTRLRNQIHRISAQRYGKESSCHLYPYLESAQLQGRQALLGQWMAAHKPQHILDIGPYVSPIGKWLRHCPKTVVAVEPCGELVTGIPDQPWLSTELPCPVDPSQRYVYTVAPMTIREFQELPFAKARPFDGIVCVGCDGHFGPQSTFFAGQPRPFSIYMEHPPAYTPSSQLAAKIRALPSCTVQSSATFNFTGTAEFAGLEKPFRENRLVEHLHCAATP